MKRRCCASAPFSPCSAGKSLGLAWGGDWQSIQDEPHFELHPPWAAGLSEGEMLANLRARHEAGREVFA